MHPKLKRQIIELCIILFVVLGVLVSVPAFRAQNSPEVYSPESYSELRLSAWYGADTLIEPHRQVNVTPYNYFLGLEFNKIWLQILLGVLSAIGLWLIINKIGIPRLGLSATLLTAISPGFIRYFTTISYEGFGIFLMILGGYLISSNKKIQWLLGGIVLVIASGLGMFYFVGCVIMFWGVKKNILGSLVFTVFSGLAFLQFAGIQPIQPVAWLAILNKLVFDFGGLSGLSLSGLILGIIGLLFTWKKTGISIGIYFIILAGLLNMWLFGAGASLLVVLLPGFSGYTLLLLLNRKWIIPSLKYFTLFFGVVGLVLPGLVSISLAISAPPNAAITAVLSELESLPPGVVLAAAPEGPYIQYFANKPVLLDGKVRDEVLLNKTTTIFYSRNLERTKQLLDELNIRYIFITPRMRDELWREQDQGLQFLFRNNESFGMVTSINNVELWLVK